MPARPRVSRTTESSQARTMGRLCIRNRSAIPASRARATALARKLGAEIAIDAKTQDPPTEIQNQIGGAHGVLVTAVSTVAFKQALGMLRRGGTCVLNGLPPGEFPVSIFDVVLNRYTIRGSIVGTRLDLEEALTFAAEGKVKATIETQPLESINNVFQRLKTGKVNGRIVLGIAAGASEDAFKKSA